MNCSQCQEQLVAYIEGLLEPTERKAVAAHLHDCPGCQEYIDELSRLHDRLLADGEAVPKESLDDRVMDRIFQRQANQIRRIKMRKRYGKAGLGLAVAAAVILTFFVAWPGSPDSKVSAAEVLRQGIQALANIQSVYIKANIRAELLDNFEMICLHGELVPIEMWKQFGDPPLWRVEKPGRVIVMDGQYSLLLIRGGSNIAAKQGTEAKQVVGWLGNLFDVDQVLDQQLQLAEKQGWELLLTHEQGAEGAEKLVVTIEAKSQDDFSNTNDWLKNKTISTSDNRRVYRFDAETKLLEDLQVFVHTDKGPVLIFEITQIDYDAPLDPALFTLTLPDNVVWLEQPEPPPDRSKMREISAEEAAQAARDFFQACAEENWDKVAKFLTMSSVPQKFKDYLGGLELLDIGTPFHSGSNPTWFVHYKIKVSSGDTNTCNLAIAHIRIGTQYIIKGGI